MLREDNADLRLTEKGRELGRWTTCVGRVTARSWSDRTRTSCLRDIWMHPHAENVEQVNALLKAPLSREANGEELLRRPEMDYAQLTGTDAFAPPLDDVQAAEQVEIQSNTKATSLASRKRSKTAAQRKHRVAVGSRLPSGFGAIERGDAKLNDHKPNSIGRASRISGITPAAISILLIWLKSRDCCAAAHKSCIRAAVCSSVAKRPLTSLAP